MRVILIALLTSVALLGDEPASTIRVLSAVGMRQVLLDLEPKFERASGHTLDITFDSSGIIANRLESGEAIDVVLINQAGLDRRVESGKIVTGTPAKIATSIVAVAVRAGDAKPDVSTASAFRATMLAARMVSLPDPALDGSSGVHLANVFERLRITASMKAKTVFAAPPGPNASTPGSLVASGKADIALHQMQELFAVPGLTIAGPLPADLQQTFVFSAAISTRSADAAAARALIDFLQSRDSRAVITATGMGLPVK